MTKEKNMNCNWKGSCGSCGTNGAVYGLGFIGASVYFLQQATSLWTGIVGILKAIVWPAFLVYEVLKYFSL